MNRRRTGDALIGRRRALEQLVKTTYLEMTSASQATPFRGERRLELRRAEVSSPEFNRFLYVAVGSDWWWYSRLDWSRDRWLAYLDRPELETWVGTLSGTPAGYAGRLFLRCPARQSAPC